MENLNSDLCFTPNNNQLTCPAATSCFSSSFECQATQAVANCGSNKQCLVPYLITLGQKNSCAEDILLNAINGTAPNNFAKCKQISCSAIPVCFTPNPNMFACPSSCSYTCSSGEACGVINAIAACKASSNIANDVAICIMGISANYTDFCSNDIISASMNETALFTTCSTVCCT